VKWRFIANCKNTVPGGYFLPVKSSASIRINGDRWEPILDSVADAMLTPTTMSAFEQHKSFLNSGELNE